MIIYHILPVEAWRNHPAGQNYKHESLQSEGFIHCTGEQNLLVEVANNYYRSDPTPYVILCIDESQVISPIRWDEVGHLRFPHIYGPLNVDAVVEVIAFPRDPDGRFILPPEWTNS